MSKWLPTILLAVTAVSSVLSPTLQSVIAPHATLVAVLGAISGILTHVLPSPLSK